MDKLAFDKRTNILIQNLRSITKRIFGSNLVGVYLHGSLALGSYNPQVSDVDYLIVVSDTPSQKTKIQLMRATFKYLIPYAPQKGLEFHVLTQNELRSGKHPFYFDLHYSPMHQQAYCTNPDGYVASMHGHDFDLAVHLAVTWQSGIVVTGQPIRRVFESIAKTDYLDSALRDVYDAEIEIIDKPVYTILNLCRLISFMEDGIIRSKASGGNWGLEHFDSAHQALIKWAVAKYTGAGVIDATPQSEALIDFAHDMLVRIKKAPEL